MSPTYFPKPIIAAGVLVIAVVGLIWFMPTRSKSVLKPADHEISRPVSTGEGDKEAVPFGGVVPLDPPARRSCRIENVRHDPTSVRFDFVHDATAESPEIADPFLFVIPEARSPRLKINEYRITSDDRATSETRALESAALSSVDVASGTQLRRLGVMRRWNLCSLELKSGFLQPYTATPPVLKGELRVSMSIEWSEPFEPDGSRIEDGVWNEIAARIVANPDGIEMYAIASPRMRGEIEVSSKTPWDAVGEARDWFRFSLREEGLYQLDMDEFVLAGVASKDAHPESIRVFRMGVPVQLLRVGEGNAQKVYMWHTASDSAYSAEKTYYAVFDKDLVDARVDALPSALLSGELKELAHPTREAVLDRDNKIMIESGNFLAIKQIIWVDAPVVRGRPVDIPLTLYAPAVDENTTLTATLAFAHEPSHLLPSHRIHLKLGEQSLGTMLLRSEEDLTQQVKIPLALMRDGANDFHLELDNLPEMKTEDGRTTVWLDSIRLPYPAGAKPDHLGRLTLRDDSVTTGLQSRWTPLAEGEDWSREVALALAPNGELLGRVLVTERAGVQGFHWPAGRGYRVEVARLEMSAKTRGVTRVASDNWVASDGDVELLIVTHRDFLAEASRLADFHRAEGRSVRLMDIQSVFDHYSGGDSTPHALRAMLADMLGRMGGRAPESILLFGDCSSDYRGVTRSHVKNHIPSFTYDAGLDDWASDYWFTTVTDDHLQDFMLARVSVSNAGDAGAVVDKIIKYSRETAPGGWRGKVAFVADDGGFVDPIEELRRKHTPPGMAQERIYLNEDAPLEDNMYLPSKVVRQKRMKVSPVLTARIREAFNQGTALIDYYGHGSPNIWMEERIWFGGDSANSDNQFLAHSGHMSFVTTMTCNTGAIDYPVPKGLPGGGWNICISEDMLRQPNGGAVALYVPSGPSVTGIQHRMSIELHRALFEDRIRQVGALQAAATTRYLARGAEHELAYMLIMLGDPTMRLRLVEDVRSFTPPKRALRPGERLRFSVAAGELRAGKFMGEVRSWDGHVLAVIPETPFKDGVIACELTTPETSKDTTATLALYAWEMPGERDLAAAGQLRIERPRLRIESAEWSSENEVRVWVRNESEVVGEGQVSLHCPPDAPDALARASVSVNAKTSAGVKLHLNDPVEGDAVEVRLNGATATAARLMTLKTDAPEGIVPEASRRRTTEDGRFEEFEIVARGSPSGTPKEIILKNEVGDVLGRGEAVAIAGGLRAAFQVESSKMARLTSGTLSLVAAGQDVKSGGLAGGDEVPISAIPVDRPRLSIPSDSVRIHPASPFDGQTIWVEFDVANLGRERVPSFKVGLYDGPPEVGSLLIADHFQGSAQRTEPPLDPGERRRTALRADPVDNAGQMRWVLRADPGNSRGDSTVEDLTVPIHVFVRRKADLNRGGTRMEERRGPAGESEFVLIGEVSNDGETDAHGIMVVFYASESRTAENILGRTLLATLRAGERVGVELKLDAAMLGRIRALGDAAKPNHQLILNWRRTFGEEETPGRRR